MPNETMLKNIPLTDIEVPELRSLYESAFPEEEQIPYEDLKRLMRSMPIEFLAWYDEELFVGLTIVYRRADFSWFWYFAVREELRGKGYGQQILNRLQGQYTHQALILDMESPLQPADNSKQRQRRYDFYLRNGFHDTHVCRTFEGITFTILMAGNLPFTDADYDTVLGELRQCWEGMPTEE